MQSLSAASARPPPLTEKKREELREKWFKKTEDLWGPRELELPPMREINHSIPLIDETKVLHSRTPKCPEAYRPALLDKINRYTAAGLWKRTNRTTHTHQHLLAITAGTGVTCDDRS